MDVLLSWCCVWGVCVGVLLGDKHLAFACVLFYRGGVLWVCAALGRNKTGPPGRTCSVVVDQKKRETQEKERTQKGKDLVRRGGP